MVRVPLTMSLSHQGELAALATACCWTVTALAFESAGRRIGSLAVNVIRLALALVFFVAYGWILRGRPLPTDASTESWLWLGASGLVGFTLGDLLLFRAFVVIGARRSMLIMSLVPPFTALFGWLIMGERLAGLDWLGMTLTLGGVTWVVLERPRDQAAVAGRPSVAGLALAVGGAAGQALGLVLSKRGMGTYDAFAATQIRVIVGLAGFAVLFTLIRRWSRVLAAFRDRPAMGRTLLGSFFGPFLGVALSLLAVQHTQAGVAATIMAVVPVLIIPPAVLIFGERVGLRGVLGALVTVAGTALLFL